MKSNAFTPEVKRANGDVINARATIRSDQMMGSDYTSLMTLQVLKD